MAAETWNNNDPSSPSSTTTPRGAVIEDAAYKLTILRSPMRQTDAVLRLHALATLIAAGQAQLPQAVADARDQHHPPTSPASSASPPAPPNVATTKPPGSTPIR